MSTWELEGVWPVDTWRRRWFIILFFWSLNSQQSIKINHLLFSTTAWSKLVRSERIKHTTMQARAKVNEWGREQGQRGQLTPEEKDDLFYCSLLNSQRSIKWIIFFSFLLREERKTHNHANESATKGTHDPMKKSSKLNHFKINFQNSKSKMLIKLKSNGLPPMERFNRWLVTVKKGQNWFQSQTTAKKQ